MDDRPDPAVHVAAAPPAPLVRWRCAAPAGLHAHGWRGDDEAVVFDADSGRTHALPMPAVRLLLRLKRRGEATLPALAAAAGTDLEVMRLHLAVLAGLGLVERTVSP